MLELSKERIDQMLHEETVKKEEVSTILRCIYLRYMRLYETYFADIDALNEDVITELRNSHEETKSLIKNYYMDMPQDVCKCLAAFDKEYSEKLLGPDWQKYLSGIYRDFKENHSGKNRNREARKAEFEAQTLEAFYDAMDYVFRDGFGTGSQTVDTVVGGISQLLFGKNK